VAESIKTLRSFGGNLAIVTQTIPALDEIYGENTRRSLQGGAGVKLYLTPSEQKTIEELSQAVGKTTKRVITRSRAVGRNPFEGRSVSERTEDTSLLTEDQARRMDLDEVILVIDAQMPIRARRIKYFEDPALKVLHVGQAGSFPYPDEDRLRTDRQMTETRETVEKLRQELRAVKADGVAKGDASTAALPHGEVTVGEQVKLKSSSRGRAARAAAAATKPVQLAIDLGHLAISEKDQSALASAVQTTRSIIGEHA